MEMRISISGLSERDIDLLLAEELFVSGALRAYFLDAVGLPSGAAGPVRSVRRGVTHSTGESDLELDVLLADGQRARLLIENKVDAAFQRMQQARYTERAAAYLRAGQCDVARTLIVAPDCYLSDDAFGFDAAVTYEELIDVLLETDRESGRMDYRASILRAAIEKATLGYQREADSDMTALWREYADILAQVAPDLQMPPEEGRPTGSHFVFFRQDSVPRPLQLIHKFAYGNVDIQIPKWGAALAALREHLGPSLPSGVAIVKAGQSAALRASVQRVVISSDPEQRQKAIQAGVLAARELLEWARSNRKLLEVLRNPPA